MDRASSEATAARRRAAVRRPERHAGPVAAAGAPSHPAAPHAPALRLVAYERVSTARQGASGLGLEAQRTAIDAFARSRGATVLARFTEVESGKLATRPELSHALQLARLTGATLVIARLDRLSRNAAFLLTLRDSGVRFLAADMPEANDLTVGVMALVAQAEREAISRRTKEALAAAKARGVKLGSANDALAFGRAGKGVVALQRGGHRQSRSLRNNSRARRQGAPVRPSGARRARAGARPVERLTVSGPKGTCRRSPTVRRVRGARRGARVLGCRYTPVTAPSAPAGS
jgi:DNA invertase Pin-like site-specific DNA recombinase